MSPTHIIAVTLGSSVCGSLAQLLEWWWRGERTNLFISCMAYGTGGIASAFSALVAAAEPQQRARSLTFLVPSAQVWVAVAVQLALELATWSCVSYAARGGGPKIPVPGRMLSKPWTAVFGGARNVGGAVFGLVYYYYVLKGGEDQGRDAGTQTRESEEMVDEQSQHAEGEWLTVLDPTTMVDDVEETSDQGSELADAVLQYWEYNPTSRLKPKKT